ncbi:nucleoside diphosphate kinase regulator [Rhizorhabdus dicambivorans]|uniref:Transcription elongation factor GreAB n=1 Tax=Rhizorhabdus dicambivorans TaxID=1850238 RepID=A0A2A4FZE8_9SPHN|nr:nucleoside diphosphate kinase regulator [Rhizorhabdus dicambivorans]ATE65993.1 transcription elongation factor GreAB [Rhizorhabdus dicambivorans]PCE43110.1 transcription elongation factor GreAB [Rhizorhabdus dicambivorans]
MNRPPIQLIDSEADMLANLAISVEQRLPQVSELLLDEIARAEVRRAGDIPRDVVIMGTTVEFVSDSTGQHRTVQLVLPQDEDISNGRISILTPVGAGLIGLREGQSIMWPDRGGREHRISILRVDQTTVTA